MSNVMLQVPADDVEEDYMKSRATTVGALMENV